MKKVTIYLSVAFVLILCTFGAGCVSTDGNGGSISIPGVIDSEAQGKYEYYLNIYDTKPTDWMILTTDFTSYKLSGDPYDFFSVPGRIKDYSSFSLQLNSDTTFSIKNGVMLDAASSSQHVFIIEDKSVEDSYYITLNHLDESEKSITEQVNILYLTPTDYRIVITEFENWFNDKYNKDKRKIAQSDFDYYQNIFNTKPDGYKITSGDVKYYGISKKYALRELSVKYGDTGKIYTYLDSADTFPIKDGVMLDEMFEGTHTEEIFLIKDSTLSKSYVVEFQTIPDRYGYSSDEQNGFITVASILYFTPEDYSGLLSEIEHWFENR